MKNRNPIARNLWKFNKPKAYTPKKGKGVNVRRKPIVVSDELRYG